MTVAVLSLPAHIPDSHSLAHAHAHASSSTSLASALAKDPIPRSRRALLTSRRADGSSTWTVEHSRPLPALGKTQVLVRTVAVGLNPFDWQSVQYGFGVGPEPKAMGRDGAGDVLAVGSEVRDIEVGDRVRGRVGRAEIRYRPEC
jgi:hypothetical protein